MVKRSYDAIEEIDLEIMNKVLSCAAEYKNEDILRLLVQILADPNRGKESADLALLYAAKHGYLDIVKITFFKYILNKIKYK